MLKCMASNGFLSNEADMKISPQDPYEYLQTAELNQRSVGFIPAGTKVRHSVAEAPLCGHCLMTACSDASVSFRTLHAPLLCDPQSCDTGMLLPLALKHVLEWQHGPAACNHP